MDFYNYFRAIQGGFWQWEEQGEVIALPGGSTIAYRDYIITLLNTLADQSIPPFGVLLMALAATNPNGQTTLDTELAPFWERDNASTTYTNGFAFLKTLASVPAAYKTGQKRLLLLQTIVADTHNSLNSKTAKALLTQLVTKQYDSHKLLTPEVSVNPLPSAELQVLALLSRRFPTVDSILQKMAGLPEVPALLPDETLFTTPSPTDWVQQLLDEPKTFEVGALVKRFWSGLAIPFQQALPNAQPIGGVADLSNKGDLSRLLVSEFANDDLIFLSRLANGEALYLNREQPPASDNRDRIILIDVSLKNWGTPRTLAFALTVAIARHPKTTTRCTAFAVGNDCNRLSFDTVDSIIDGLQVLAGCLHPAPGLVDYFKNYAPADPSEVFFISSPATVRLPAMQQALSQYQANIRYQLLTDSTGMVSLYRQQRSGRKHVQDIALPLAELWRNKPKARTPALTPRMGDRPDPPVRYPLLFPSDGYRRHWVQTEDGEIYQISAEKHLFRLYSKTARPHEKGWQLLYQNLPFQTSEFDVGTFTDGRVVLLLFKPETGELVLLNLATHQIERTHFAEWKSAPHPHFFFDPTDQGFIFRAGQRNPDLIITLTDKVAIRELERPKGDLASLYSAWEQRMSALSTVHRAVASVLKNVNSIYINSVDNLVLNTHELQLLGGTVVKFKTTGPSEKRHEATAIDRQTFSFAGGSTIFINRAGMMVLTSSNAATPVIFVPLMLDSALGMATETAFAGSAYYSLSTTPSDPKAVGEFWHQYIVPFVQTISQYGTKPQTP